MRPTVHSKYTRSAVVRTGLKHLLLFVAYGSTGALLALVVGYIALTVAQKPALQLWHRAVLDEEFTAGKSDQVRDFAAYRQLEDRLFVQLRREVYERIDESARTSLNRYAAGSRSDPGARTPDWSRSYELPVPTPRAAALLVHGFTDSPYLLRGIAERLHEHGTWVVGLRLPGHGTVPEALTHVRLEDWTAAVRLAARHLREAVGADVPLYLVGFSTGAALSVEFALARLEGEVLPAVEGLILVSPAIGVDPLAPLAVWQARLARLPGLEKLAWLSIGPEYDPYRYISQAVNGGYQVYLLTRLIGERLDRLAGTGVVQGLPRTLVFQSVADATVSTPAVVRSFLGRLAAEGHELVVFDINLRAEVEQLLVQGARLPAERLLAGEPLAFDYTLVSNDLRKAQPSWHVGAPRWAPR